MMIPRNSRLKDELVCRVHILNTLFYCLYDFYINNQSVREIWKALEFKFCVEKNGTKKSLISNYIDFKMLDSNSILAQEHELQFLVNKLRVVKLDFPKAFQVGEIIAKLPSSRKSYKKKLFHSFDDFSLEQINKHLRIKEESKDREKYEVVGYSMGNTVSTKVKKKQDDKKNYLGHNKDQNKFKNSSGSKGHNIGFYVCGKHDHYTRDYKNKKS